MRRARSSARVFRRRGMVKPDEWVAGTVVATVGAVGLHSSGNSSRLPGVVVWVCPSGAVQMMVPSGSWRSCQPPSRPQKVLSKCCHRIREEHFYSYFNPSIAHGYNRSSEAGFWPPAEPCGEYVEFRPG
jgi:hypothetical protein